MLANITYLLVTQWQKDYNLIDPSKKLISPERLLQHRVKLFVEIPNSFEILFVPTFRRCNKSVEIW
jgi:hypothetical protein